MKKMRLLVLVHGAWAGWMMALLLVRSEIIPLPTKIWPDDVIGYCTYAGYPKLRDYFIYVLFLLSGVMGSLINWFLLVRIKKALNIKRIIPGCYQVLIVCILVATGLAFRLKIGTPLVIWPIFIFSYLLPWFDGRWYEESGNTMGDQSDSNGISVLGKYILGIVSIFVVFWLFDPCIAFRKIDGMAEGWYVASIQAIQYGGKPNADFQINYGPLYIYSIYWWMKYTVTSLLSQRWYFMFCQIIGTLCVLAAFLIARISLGWLVAGIFMVLLGTVSGYYGVYGWPNTLRIALPLLSLAVLWGSLFRRPSVLKNVLLGMVYGVSIHYSPDYSVAAGLGMVVLYVMANGNSRSMKISVWPWLAGATLSYAVVFVAMFGWVWPIHGVVNGESYMLKRMLGHGAWPLPPVPWYIDTVDAVKNMGQLSWLVSAWISPLLCVFSLAFIFSGVVRNERRNIMASLAVFTLVSHVPAMIRPLAQISMSNVPAIVLLILMVDSLYLKGKLAKASVFIGLTILLGLLFKQDGLTNREGYWGGCDSGKGGYREVFGLERVKGIKMSEYEAGFIEKAAAIIKANTKPTDRILMADNYNQDLLFIADRAPFLPYPQILLVATRDDEIRFAHLIEAGKPRMAIINTFNADVPLISGYPNIWSVICRKYKLLRKINDTSFYVLRGRT